MGEWAKTIVASGPRPEFEMEQSRGTDKPLLLAAIEAVARIRPLEAAEILNDLTDSDDEGIVDAVFETRALPGGPSDEDDELRH